MKRRGNVKLVDPERSWSQVERRLESETDERRRLILTQVRDHMRAELREQLEPTMATLTETPDYNFYGFGGGMSFKGRAGVEAYYREMFAQGRMNAEFEVTRIVVDDNSVVTEGMMIALVPATELVEAGIAEVAGAKVADGATYLSRVPLLVVWPADKNGRIIGENIYIGAARYDNLKRVYPKE